jgi:hypothetical protein
LNDRKIDSLKCLGSDWDDLFRNETKLRFLNNRDASSALANTLVIGLFMKELSGSALGPAELLNVAQATEGDTVPAEKGALRPIQAAVGPNCKLECLQLGSENVFIYR